MENYRYVRQIGQGSYGQVWLMRSKKDKKQFVLKQIKIENVSRRELRTANLEVQLLATLRHPNIVSYKDSFQTGDGFLYIAMGYCEGGDLYTKIKEQNGVPFEEKQIVQWFIQICMALQYLHERKILHRDLKTKNIFLTKRNIVRVGDLGIAKVLEGDTAMATTMIGTPYYMSPELFSNRPYNFKSDIWALGCCIYELATLKHAFDARDMNSLMYKIVRGKLPTMPSQYSTMLRDLIVKMLSHDPMERPSVTRILRNQFVRKNIEIFLAGTRLMKHETKTKQVVSTPRVVSTVLRHSKRIENVNLSVNGVKLLAEKVTKLSLDVESGVFCDADEGISKGVNIENNVELPAIQCKPIKNKKQSSMISNVEVDASKEDNLCVDGQEILLEEKPTERGSCDSSPRRSRNNDNSSKRSDYEKRLLHSRHMKQSHDEIPNVNSEFESRQLQIKSDNEINSECVNEVSTSQLRDPIVRNLPPLSVKNAAMLNHPLPTLFDPKCLPVPLDSILCNEKLKHWQISPHKPLPPLQLAITDACDGSGEPTERQRPPNSTARQRRRQKQLKELSRTPKDEHRIRDDQNGCISLQVTTDINHDLIVDLTKNPDSAPLRVTKKSSSRKCRRSFSLSNLEDVDITKVNTLSLLKQHISYLEKDCIRGLGRDLLERVLELLDGDPTELKTVLNTKRDSNFITKLFRLKLCRDSLKNFPQI